MGAVVALTPEAGAEAPGSQKTLSEDDHDRAQHARERGEIRPLEEILPTVRERFPGEVAQIELEREQGIWIYEFKIIDRAGRLLEIRIDAMTGRVAKIGGE